MHGQMEEKSHTLHGKIQEITAGFAELSDSVQTEKEQFYQLTAETIDKAEVMRSQFAEIAKQITHDRSVIENLKTDIESVRKVLDSESIQELNLFGQRSKEMMSTWMDIQNRQKMLALRYSRISVWLWILTFGMGVILVLLIAILIRLN
jgi:septation ring formation regulator EzrA